LMGLALSQERSEAAKSVLDKLRSTSFSRAVLLLEKDGGISLAVGDATNFDLTPFSVLSAACVSAGQELASLVGEDDFQAMVHQGSGISVYLETVDSESILGVVFDRKTTLGLVKLRVSKTKKKLANIVKGARSEQPKASVVGMGFAEEAGGQLDELFGG
jgi:predicted regulator of Ras-like GTPase activity (Roadblock/LC7/MglB family)